MHKATWKGTEVAVKMMLSDNPSRDLERPHSFAKGKVVRQADATRLGVRA